MTAAALLSDEAAARRRVRLTVRGTVQGVGFRPFVFRSAVRLGLGGSVANTPAGVRIEAEGPPDAVAAFVAAIRAGPPPPAQVAGLDVETIVATGEAAFTIAPSATAGARDTGVLPDLATCAECLRELLDPADRRYRYPFINCTHCGPRYSIVEGLPYDRARTSMRRFTMCEACRAEYEDPADRRFHAEPNACSACGPRLAVMDGEGRPLAGDDAALLAAAAALRAGAIVAVKGLGGFHLLVDARDGAAVQRLRTRKARPEKPFAVMFPSLAAVAAGCEISPAEADLLASPERPVVVLAGRQPARGTSRRHGEARAVAAAVSPDIPSIGALLPYTPLHHLLMAELDFPVVATSGNRADEPIVIDGGDALSRLSGIADLLLTHDRIIVRPLDDSVARVVAGEPLLLRRGRGYAPALATDAAMPCGIVAFGGQEKAAVAVTLPGGIVLGPHIGDLDAPEGRDAYGRAVADIARLNAVAPRVAAHDLHPDYHSTHAAEAAGIKDVAVQHHLAHVAAGMAENRLAPPVLGVAFDGTGYGADGTVWGGEFLRVAAGGWRRVAHLRPFRLPGGEAAIREPRRGALGVLFEAFGPAGLAMTGLPPVAAFSPAERRILAAMVGRGLNAPVTSSAGRLFDAVAALLGLCQRATYEGQAATMLEWAARDAPDVAPAGAAGSTVVAGVAYDFPVVAADAAIVLDWVPALRALVRDIAAGAPVAAMARRFHQGLADGIAAVAARIGEKRVVLTGGCFQNKVLTEAAIAALDRAGLTPFRHRLVPPNDGGLALGQAAWVASLVTRGELACA